MVEEFLAKPELSALVQVIAAARKKDGVHRVHTADAEILAYQNVRDIRWAVIAKTDDTAIATGSVPLHQRSLR